MWLFSKSVFLKEKLSLIKVLMILSGSPALLWEWKVLVCRDSQQQIEFADFFFFFASRNQLGMQVRWSAGRGAAGCPVEPCADRRGSAVSVLVNFTVLRSWWERNRLLAHRLDFVLI